MLSLRLLVLLLCAVFAASTDGFGQSADAVGATQPAVRALSGGVEVVADGVTLRVTALRDDVLRVRMWRGGSVPEDASWAVLPASRTASVKVTAEADGFQTGSLRVTVGARLRLTVADLAGNVLQLVVPGVE